MRPKKSLGQNFLTSRLIINTMVLSGSATEGDIIIEIGPGKGALTQKLIESGATIIALEKDPELARYLHEKFSDDVDRGALIIHEGDALDLETDDFIQAKLSELTREHTRPYKVIANIPYYITGAILRTYLSAEHQPSEMVLLMQKEVAQRIVSRDDKMSLLSLSVALYGTAHYVKKVPPQSFSPAPAVDSAILHITDIGRRHLPKNKEVAFFELLQCAFAHKRKTVTKNLKIMYDADTLAHIWKELEIDPHIRAEDIDLSTWLRIFENL